jgi:hypothetical protein
MIVDNYEFGRIRVEEKTYTSDLIIFPDRVNSSWWRQEGHRLDPEDLSEVLREPPEILVIGTGYSGCMTVPEATVEALRSRGMEVRASRTADAVKDFNRLQREHVLVVAALHLTC